ncbi:hypothetical protein [Haloarcula salinisoli]|uniref:Uncharacterized protein n=1 Tax=Haloarcula salinisoli TaxID=2487746 RepID=A0A8J7YAB0_9EURY|nr:hypothetical protein [Halomicroarcula salinisoli]MBX0286227.1 hypothetical protein [Halomicroarcula salinisoli]MBX0302285.1 hypothetical protein [Halomicroarcula salinisoli]
MTDGATADGDLTARIETTVAERLGDGVEWALSEDSTDQVTVALPDRRLVVHRRDGPAGVDHWTLELAADGATVSKFGPFETVDALTERIGSLLDSEVRYTVCCDG